MSDALPPLPDEDALAERGRLLVAGAVAETDAPLSLRERIEADRAALGRRPGGLRARRLRPFAWAAGALAAIVLVAVLVAGGNGGPSKGPSVLAVAKATEAGPSAGAPRADGRGFVDAKVPPV